MVLIVSVKMSMVLLSQQRTAAAYAAGHYDAELAPMTTVKSSNETKKPKKSAMKMSPLPLMKESVILQSKAYKVCRTVIENGVITAGNASQLSDGASASVLMEAKLVERRGLQPLGRYVGMTVAGCEPDEWVLVLFFAIPKLLKTTRLKN